MQRLSTLTAQTPYESQTMELLLYCMHLAHKEQHLTFPLNITRGEQRLLGT